MGNYVWEFYSPGYAEYSEAEPTLANQALAPGNYDIWLFISFATVEANQIVHQTFHVMNGFEFRLERRKIPMTMKFTMSTPLGR